MTSCLEDDLMALAIKHKMLGKGFLGLALTITERAQRELPLDLSALMTEGGGQVRGAGGGAVRRILLSHGIERRLSSEGGRTSRGTPAKARALAEFINAHACDPALIPEIMAFWIARVRDFFAAKPFKLELDPALGVGETIRRLLDQAQKRQAETLGATTVGTVVQHLVGAKLEIRLGRPERSIAMHGASVNDASQRSGDLEIGDSAVHVTTAPSQLLIEKCATNARNGLRPIIVTSADRTTFARTLLSDAGIGTRVDVFDYEQFLAANVFEMGGFEPNGRKRALVQIVDRYNAIIDSVEGDPGLRIELV